MSYCNQCNPCNNLRLSIEVIRLGSLGQQVDYRFRIFNEGPAAATNTILSVAFTGRVIGASPEFGLFPLISPLTTTEFTLPVGGSTLFRLVFDNNLSSSSVNATLSSTLPYCNGDLFTTASAFVPIVTPA